MNTEAMDLTALKQFILDKYPKSKKNFSGTRCANTISIEQLIFEIEQFEKSCEGKPDSDTGGGLHLADVMPRISHFEDECGNKYNGNYIECTVGIDNQLSFYLDYGNESPTIPVIPKYGA